MKGDILDNAEKFCPAFLHIKLISGLKFNFFFVTAPSSFFGFSAIILLYISAFFWI